jgi:galactofuranosylgalactofuranosylrhamnosyl-N-acetylglucosaminyl-diphospho-decaprenol beta-1,5/1,6-galactofuranosyltransferase
LLKEALSLRKQLAAEFPALKARYRDAVPHLTSKETWERVFRYQA